MQIRSQVLLVKGTRDAQAAIDSLAQEGGQAEASPLAASEPPSPPHLDAKGAPPSSSAPEFLPVPTSVDRITPLVRQILIEVESARAKGEVWEIYLFHNQPKEGSLYEPVSKRLLPLDNLWQEKLIATPWPTKSVPEIMGGVDSVLADFIRGYLFVSLFQACAESLASENASRLAAMQRAEKNIADMLDNLNGTLHRMRQESIDEELFDVISGFEALTKRANAESDKCLFLCRIVCNMSLQCPVGNELLCSDLLPSSQPYSPLSKFYAIFRKICASLC